MLSEATSPSVRRVLIRLHTARPSFYRRHQQRARNYRRAGFAARHNFLRPALNWCTPAPRHARSVESVRDDDPPRTPLHIVKDAHPLGTESDRPTLTIADVAKACGLPQPVIAQLVPRTWTEDGWMYTEAQLQQAVEIAAGLTRPDGKSSTADSDHSRERPGKLR